MSEDVKTPSKRGRKSLADTILKDANKTYEDVKDVVYQGNDTIEIFMTPLKMKALLESKMYRSPKTGKTDKDGNLVYDKKGVNNHDKELPGYEQILQAIAIHPSIDIELIQMCIKRGGKVKELVMQNILNGAASLSLMIPEFYEAVLEINGISSAFLQYGSFGLMKLGFENYGISNYETIDTMMKNILWDDPLVNTVRMQLEIYEMIVGSYLSIKNNAISEMEKERNHPEKKAYYYINWPGRISSAMYNISNAVFGMKFKKAKVLHEKLSYFIAEEAMSITDIDTMYMTESKAVES